MIIFTNDHVEISYQPDNSHGSYSRTVLCCDITQEHIPDDLYIRSFQRDISQPNTSQILSHTPQNKEHFKIDISKFHFVFTERAAALKYFLMFADFNESKDIEILFPELFL